MTTIDSKIPDRHPHRQAIESTVRELLGATAESWHVRIEPARTSYWWLLTMRRESDGHVGSLFVEPVDQNMEGVARVVRELLSLLDER